MQNVAHNNQDGFSLMEIMIALIIMGIVGTLGFTALNSRLQQAKLQTTQTNLKTLKENISLFQMQLGAYPTKLMDLVERPKGDLAAKWAAPYITYLPQDAWGNDFFYKLTPGGKHPYTLYSYGSEGPDGAPENRIDAWNLQ